MILRRKVIRTTLIKPTLLQGLPTNNQIYYLCLMGGMDLIFREKIKSFTAFNRIFWSYPVSSMTFILIDSRIPQNVDVNTVSLREKSLIPHSAKPNRGMQISKPIFLQNATCAFFTVYDLIWKRQLNWPFIDLYSLIFKVLRLKNFLE